MRTRAEQAAKAHKETHRVAVSSMCNPSRSVGLCDSSFVNHWTRVFQWPGTAGPPASRYRLFKCSIGERLKFMQGHWGCDNYNHRFLALQWQPFVIFTWVIPAAQGCWQACTDLVACSPLFPLEPPQTSRPQLPVPNSNRPKPETDTPCGRLFCGVVFVVFAILLLLHKIGHYTGINDTSFYAREVPNK